MTQLPRIHLNGTDGRQLAEEYGAAITSLEHAIMTLRCVTVHGRDYYPINDTASSKAYAEHQQRIAMLVNVQSELNLIYTHIFEHLVARENDRRVMSS